ncbi:succinate dehydrogenase subunit C [Nitrosospira multiformis ATCC 25196]|uniref:Succinate dehydrogenase cytochrome b556 subunit n=1 Tax=Nitrosospira multiformis (strain ATCC 25196 / NCIMB 11849 / C 71) TaxID=323848 RepID=Q2YAQ5_NITMU|nr:succinate dehydrogenase, cytochrome b556 subunit [Nitrosospira multiformis]ABB74166.1 succinate dehydrogenase subunit C [Nitrosospira multiformis ATCC 25196]SEF46454.1 succinate dehydrogenase subunit C [Nitrosospira multiformis ATCC 25196]
MPKKRPKYLDLLKIRQPLPAVISILHRISGALLFFPGIPLVLCGLDMALGSSEDYARLQSFLNNPMAKFGLILALWFFLHHFCAGIRYLALDLHYGVKLEQARLSSKVVVGAGIVLTLLTGAVIW